MSFFEINAMPSKKKKKSGRGKARKAGSSSKQKETQQGSLDAQMERLNINGGDQNDSRANDEASLFWRKQSNSLRS